MATTKPQIPVGFAKAAATIKYGPATAVNVFYFAITPGSHTPGEVIAAIAQAVHDLYATFITLSEFPTNWSLQWTTVTYRDADDSIVRVRVTDVQVGTNVGAGQDAQVAYLINWSTGDPRRGGKPRQYIPGVLDSVMADPASLVSSLVANASTNLITWLTGLPGRAIPLQLVEMSFRNGNTWRDAAAHFPIIGASLNPVVATQRRRVDRLRPH